MAQQRLESREKALEVEAGKVDVLDIRNKKYPVDGFPWDEFGIFTHSMNGWCFMVNAGNMKENHTWILHPGRLT